MIFRYIVFFFAMGVYSDAVLAAPGASDQLDEMDRQELRAHIDRAKACIQSRSFSCATEQLTKAQSFVNGASDRDVLQRAWQDLEYNRQIALSEDAKSKYSGQQAALASEGDVRQREVEEVAQAERANVAAMARARATERQRVPETQGYGAAILQGANSALSDFAAINRIHNQAIANVQNTIAERQRREQEQRDRESAQLERQRKEQREQRQQAAAQQARAQQEQTRVAQVEADADRERKEQARREQERARREEEARREAVARAEETKARELKIEQERQARVAKQEADKAAKAKAERDYLAEVKRQFKLVARTCPGGEGRYFAVGVNPNIKPELVACYGIKFQAMCRGGGISAYGGTEHFKSLSTSCFMGESVPMEPKLNCKPEDVQITVTEVNPC